jgi:hypothetical protein
MQVNTRTLISSKSINFVVRVLGRKGFGGEGREKREGNEYMHQLFQVRLQIQAVIPMATLTISAIPEIEAIAKIKPTTTR